MGSGASASVKNGVSPEVSPRPGPPRETSSTDIHPYTILLHTGLFNPLQVSVTKWHEGSVLLTLNPYSEDKESRVLEVRGSFPADSEGVVRADFWLPPNVGTPELVKVAIRSKFSKLTKDALFVRRVTVIYNEEHFVFPAKNYLFPHTELQDKISNGCLPYLLIREGPGSLLHHETEDFIIKARNKELEMTRSMVPWNGPNVQERPKLFPGYLGNQDGKEGPELFNKKFSHKAGFMALTNLLDDLLGVLPDTFDKTEQYAAFIRQNGDEQGWSKSTVQRALKVARVFGDDEEFGRQLLCGPNSVNIQRVYSLEGSRWEEMVEKIPEHVVGKSNLSEAVAQGSVYHVTNDNLVGVRNGGKASKMLTGEKQTWYVVPADCLLYAKENGKLVPILIRLENSKENPTFWWPPGPDVDKGEHDSLRWTLAKMYFRCAEVNTHALCAHYARAHAVSEVFAIAAYRNLAAAHPVFRLLQPHIQGVLPVQLQARKFLLGKNSVFAKYFSAGDDAETVFHNFFKNFNYRNLIPPEEIARRGVEDLPGYLYRDDILEHWKLLSEYVSEMVRLAYPTEEDLSQDIELQNFAREVVDEGYRYRGFPDSAGFPRSLPTHETLSEYLTAIIFNISVYHTAVTYDTFTYHSFTPASPSCLTQPPPKQDEIITPERITTSLPVPVLSFISMDTCHHLSSFSQQDRFLLGSQDLGRVGFQWESMATGKHQREALECLMDGMRKLKRNVDERNMEAYFKYDVLSPENVTISIN